MITIYTRIDKNTITIDTGKEARRIARDKAPKASGTRIVCDKRRKAPKHRKPFERED